MKGLTRLFPGRLLLCVCLCFVSLAKADTTALDTVRQLHMQVFRVSCDLFVQRGEEGLVVDQQAVRLQYMAARYTARAYIGALHTLDQPGYFDQDLKLLAEEMDQAILQLKQTGVSSEQLKPVSQRWRYIRGRYEDYQVNLAPMVVAGQTRMIVDNLLILARSFPG